ncbi:hypothetical protein [Brevundimonas sp.]|uniref:hypothetical protein n=1 Tax=Brevundimonas sp. TaxID=1871086 RepID=UPI003F7083AB
MSARFMTGAGVGLGVALLIIALLLAGRGLGLRWDPLGLDARRLERVEQQAEVATADARARTLEVEGARVQARRLEDAHQQAVELAQVTAAAEAEARKADDAHLPLDPDRIGRLRDHDRELCRIAPDVCGAAPVGAAGDRPDAVPTGSPAGCADAG